jgi:hypothetical protein
MGEGAATAEAASGGSKKQKQEKLSSGGYSYESRNGHVFGRSDGAQLCGKKALRCLKPSAAA